MISGVRDSSTSLAIMRTSLVFLGLSWLALPCLSKNQELNTERYIDGLDHDDLRTILDLKPDPWRSVEEGHLARLLIPRACELNREELR
jgi:hypothetical protein